MNDTASSAIVFLINTESSEEALLTQTLKILFNNKYNLFITKDIHEALNFINTNKHIIIGITNYPYITVFNDLRKYHPNAHNILLTEYTIVQYSDMLQNKEHQLLDNIIYKATQEKKIIEELIITLNKIINKNIFGIEKYLEPNTKIISYSIPDSESRTLYNYEVMRYCENLGLGSNMSKTIFGIVEEMLMNAIYDAPYKDGIYYYHNLSRNTKINLQPHERPILSYSCDGKIFIISCKDPFGSFKKDIFFEYIKKVIKRNKGEEIIDTKPAGAGLGLFKILYNSHKIICNLNPYKNTELIAIIDLEEPLKDFIKMGRSIHFFSI